jgi:hypothetical protein
VSGHGLSTNIIEASLDAYLAAVNKLHAAEINGVSVAFVAPRVVESSGGWHRGALPPTSEGGRPLHEEGGPS